MTRHWLYITLACMTPCLLMAQDMQLLSNRQVMGTARYVGMAGAMTAIGGDPSSVLDNPACLGLYRHFEFVVSVSQQWNKTQSLDALRTWRFDVPAMSFVIPFGEDTRQKGMLFNNLMLSYHRTAIYDQSAYLPVTIGDDSSDGSVLDLGFSDNFAISWATNISNQLYIGVGLNIPSVTYSCTVENATRYSFESQKGVGLNASVGCIYRPSQWIRIGAAYTSPSTLTLTERDQYGIVCTRNMVLPMRTTASLALQVWQYGLIAVQYDYANWKDITNSHTIRIGAEGQVWNHVFLNAGYAHDFMSLNTQYVSGAIGYRGKHIVAQAAYQYQWRTTDQHKQLITHTDNMSFLSSTHRLVVTLAWRN